jgi:hypothetical protein
MAAVIVGELLLPSPTAVVALMLNEYAETPAGLFSSKKDAQYELVAVLTHSEEAVTVGAAKTRGLAQAILAKHAADLGLLLLAPDLALRRDIIIAIHVSQSLYKPFDWCVTAKTTTKLNNTIVLYSGKSHDDAHAHMLVLYKQHFLASSSAAASETSQ